MTNTKRRPQAAGDIIPAEVVRDVKGEVDGWTTYDFGASYPLGAIRVGAEPAGGHEAGRHANGGHADSRKPLRAEVSLDGKVWAPFDAGVAASAAGAPLGLAPVRYVRLEDLAAPGGAAEAAGEAAGVSAGVTAGGTEADELAVVFIAGRGLAAEPADDWTRLFHRREGWTGSDGIYSIPLDGSERPGGAADRRTLLLFGDTFIGGVSDETDARIDPVMINNSYALLEGDEPLAERVGFHWSERGGKPASAIVPATAKGLSHEGAYYWLQDGASVGGKFYCFPLIVGPNPDGPEGFEFAVHGIASVVAPIGADGPRLVEQVQADTELYCALPGGGAIYYGAAIMPLTEKAGAPDADGYVYVYGLRNDGATRMVVARAPAGELADTARWTFWDGAGWSGDIADSAAIAPETSSEYSVTPMTEGLLAGKFAAVYQQGGIRGSRIALCAGDGPTGPFTEGIPLYYCEEPEEGKGIYAYNAKAHPHLSRPGELLVSYNVNTTSWDAHEAYGSIYRPRFIRIRQIV